MFNSDAEQAGLAGSFPGPASVCAAADLKTILNSIADQIADADQRHTHALAQMAQRLDQFGTDSAGIRAAAPAQTAQAYNRVEQRIYDLAARLASHGPARDGADYAGEPRSDTAPAALLSAAGGGASGAFTPKVDLRGDTFDVVGDMPSTDPDSPWDHQAAEALASIYQDDARPVASAPQATIELGASAVEDRFAVIASRIEQYVQDLRPLHAFSDLDERFGRLESRLDDVLAAGNSSSTLENLSSLETQIIEVTRRLEESQHHFQRLDTIESELRHLADNVTEDRLADVIKRNASAAPRLDDIANLVADHISSVLAMRDQHVSSGGSELQAILQSFVEEQRHGSEQTATMIDTMQEAMIRLLDRMDAMEQAQYATSSIGVTNDRVTSFDHDVLHDQDHTAQIAAAMDLSRETPMHHEPAPVLPREVAAQPPEVAPGRLEPTLPPPLTASTGPVAPGHAAQMDAASAIARTRSELMASARRAKEQGTAGSSDAEAPKSRSEGQDRGKPDGAKRRRSTRPSPLTLSLVALVALGAGFTAVSSFHRSAQAPQAMDPGAASSGATSGAQSGAERAPASGSGQGSAPVDATPDRRSTAEPLAGQVIPASAGAQTDGGQVIERQGRIEMPPLAVGPTSLRIAAAQGDASAQFEVGSRLAEGNGLPQNLGEAITWYERAAAQGFIMAQYRLGTHYERGLGVKIDLGRAAAWYQRAAEQGNVKAMHNLAVLSASRDQSKPDYASAAKWFSAAAAYGLTDSQYNLAVLFDSGLGVGRDLRASYKWFSVAASSGDIEAAKRRDAMKTRVEPRVMAEIESEVASWRALPIDPIANDARTAGEMWKRRAASSESASVQ